MTPGSCFRCHSSYKVAEVAKGVYCCGGFCKKLIELKGLSAIMGQSSVPVSNGTSGPSRPAATCSADSPKSATPTKPPTTPSSAPKSMKMSQSFKVNDFCRANCQAQGKVLEATVVEVQGTGGSAPVRLRFLGCDASGTCTMKELLPSGGSSARERQIKAMETSGSWKVGDPCRTIYDEDGKMYEGVIKSMLTGQAGPGGDEVKAEVEFLSYGNVVTKSLTEIYPPWKVGDACRAVYSEDGLVYEGSITEIDESEGVKYSTVEFVGYLNTETVWLTDLKNSLGKAAREIQEKQAAGDPVEATESKDYKFGDYCRAVYAEDGQEYEGEIMSVGQDENQNDYCLVRFLGYGNEETIWKNDILASHGEESRAQQLALFETPKETAADAGWKIGDRCHYVSRMDERVHDAEILEVHKSDEGVPYFTVKAFDLKTVETVWEQEMKAITDDNKKQDDKDSKVPKDSVISEKESSTPKVGDFCRAIYSEDGQEYEAEIKSIVGSNVTVVFLGYGNEETFPVEKIKPSKGEQARLEQTNSLQVAGTEEAVQGKVGDEGSSAVVPQQSDVEQKAPVIKGLKDWSVGDFCRAVYSEDGQEYEAKITAINHEGEDKFAIVVFVGYGNEESAWLQDLLESHGEEERKKIEAQFAVTAEEVVTDHAPEPAAAEAVTGTSTPDLVSSVPATADASPNVSKDSPEVSKIPQALNGTSEHNDSGLVADSSKTPDKEDQTEPNWKRGEFCRVPYVGLIDGSAAAEGLIYSISEAEGKVSVRILGLNNAMETYRFDQLSPSEGPEVRERQVMLCQNGKVTPSPTKSPVRELSSILESKSADERLHVFDDCKTVGDAVAAMRSVAQQFLSSADLKEENEELRSRLQVALREIEALKKGNFELYKMMNSRQGPSSDEMEVAVQNLSLANEKYQRLQEKCAEQMQRAAEDERKLLQMIEALKMENIALKDEVEGIKFEKQSILKECISLKAQVVGHH